MRLTEQNEKLLEEYRQLFRQMIPTYGEATDVSIVNGMLTDKLREEIKRMKGKKV